MNNRIPEVLAPALESYIFQVDQLTGFLGAFYVVGSIPLDEFNPHFNDADFIAVTSHLAADDEIKTLREIHQKVERQSPQWKLSGMYRLPNDLGKSKEDLGARIVFHDGNLKLQNSFEASPATWWILKNHGVPLLGPDPYDLPVAVDEKFLVTWTQGNLNTYWKGWTQQPGTLIILLSDWGIQWAVLGVARQFYTNQEKKIISKKRAGDYALSVVPIQWHRIINEAIRIRITSKGLLHHSRLGRMFDVIYFVNYIIQISHD